MKVKTDVIYCDECGATIPTVTRETNQEILEIQRECRRLGLDICENCVKEMIEKFL